MTGGDRSPERVLGAYAVAERVMIHAAEHDETAAGALIEQIAESLAAFTGRSVSDPLAALLDAWEKRDWPAISTRAYQLTCALPFGFPADPSRLPPPAEAIPLAWTPCTTHPGNPVWQQFCTHCGTPAWTRAQPGTHA